jgi:S1-C subfamily serine protease
MAGRIRLLLTRNESVLAAFLALVSTASGQVPLTTAQIAKKASPSVVVIQGQTDSGDDVLGSGFIVSNDGKIVTNLHVIRDMKTASVHIPSRTLPNGLSIDGKVFDSVFVLATDEHIDLAIVTITPAGPKDLGRGWTISADQFSFLALSNSDTVTVGEPVVVVGSPRGLEGTVTAGILSSVRDTGDGFKVLQTDAAVNPGNSGGPLVNGKGQAIGVVSFKLHSAEGLNFAIPVNYVRGLLNNLHAPMTLEQMRKSLRTAATPGPDGDKPSLKETLDWLKEKLPLGVIHYVRSYNRPNDAHSVIRQAMSWSLDSCTVIIGYVETSISEDIGVFVAEKRTTVPLGLLTSWSVEYRKNEESAQVTVVSGETMDYWLFLSSKSKDLLNTTSFSDPQFPPSMFTTDTVAIAFSDVSLAGRVGEAFHHASDICRKKEPF